MIDEFAAVADPTRRGMLDHLRGGERSAGEIGSRFPGTTQPGISRHLRVLRQAGLVMVRREEQRRIYALRPEGFGELDAWVARYRSFWPKELDALERHLGPKLKKEKRKKT